MRIQCKNAVHGSPRTEVARGFVAAVVARGGDDAGDAEVARGAAAAEVARGGAAAEVARGAAAAEVAFLQIFRSPVMAGGSITLCNLLRLLKIHEIH